MYVCCVCICVLVFVCICVYAASKFNTLNSLSLTQRQQWRRYYQIICSFAVYGSVLYMRYMFWDDFRMAACTYSEEIENKCRTAERELER